MKRNIDQYLREWKKDKKRKVLLIRGARQVGKTYSVRKLSRYFPHFLEINFEEESRISSFFRGSLDPRKITEKLSAYFSKSIIPGETLLFFDEIQACPEALSSLRFFYERMPDLHLIAAGSLLEFALSEIPSSGVGRIRSLFMYPMSFHEFLLASGKEKLSTMLWYANPENPLDNPFHVKLNEYFRIYQLIGGMPAVVQSYVEERNLSECQKILDDILTTLRDDFAKYKKRVSATRLSEVFDSIVFQAGNKFKYSNVDSHSSPHSIKDALNLLIQAGLAHKIHHTSARGLPLGAQINPKKFKVNLYDVGMHQRLLGLDLKEQLLSEDIKVINRGNLAEVFVGLELINNASPMTRQPLYYWHREKRGSSAEVDFVIRKGDKIVPVEVKSGTKGHMKSMYIFMKERDLKMGIRVSMENFSKYGKIAGFPLYAVRNIVSD